MHLPTARPTLSPQDRTYTMRLQNSLEPVFDLHPTMPLQYFYAFLCVAKEDLLTVTDVAARCNVSVTVASRQLKILGSHGGGLGLLASVPGTLGDKRQHHVALTPLGISLVKAIIYAYKNGAPRRTGRRRRLLTPRSGLGSPQWPERNAERVLTSSGASTGFPETHSGETPSPHEGA